MSSKKKSKMSFWVPIYRTKCTLFKRKKDLEKTLSTEIPDDCAGLVLGSCVWIDDDSREPEVIGHECYHLTRRILEHVNVDHAGDEEAVAYLIGYISKVMFEFYLEDGNESK